MAFRKLLWKNLEENKLQESIIVEPDPKGYDGSDIFDDETPMGDEPPKKEEKIEK